MKTMKKLLAITLSVAMICGVYAVIEPETVQAEVPAVEYFNETFSTDDVFDNATWSSNSTNLETWKDAVSGGKLTIPSNNTTAVYLMANDSAFMNLSDYTVSCDVTYSGVPTAETTNVVIAARTTNATNQGYAFQLTVSNKTEEDTVSTSVYVRLRDQKQNKYYTGLSEIENFDFTKTHTLKLTCSGTLIKGYVDNQLMITYNTLEHDTYATGETIVNKYEMGTAALRMATTSAGVDVSFDNFKMERLAKFYDDFDGYDGDATGEQKATALEANDWYVEDKDNASLLTGEAYVIPKENTTAPIKLQAESAEGALGWNDYSVEADVTIGQSGDTVTTPVYACVTGRHTDVEADDGYEIQLYDNANGTQRLRIYNRKTFTQLKYLDFPIEYGKEYNLKAVFQGNKIYAYIDDVLYLEAIDENNVCPVGFAGIRKNGTDGASCGVDVKFDNFVVYDYDEKMNKFVEDFEQYVPRLVDVGYDNKPLMTKGWSATDLEGKTTNGALRDYAENYVKDGVFSIPRGNKDNINMVLSNYQTAVSDYKTAEDWGNYTIECDVTFDAEESGAVTSTDYTWVYISAMNDAADYKGGFALRLRAMNAGQLRYIELYKDGSRVNGTSFPTTDTSLHSGTSTSSGYWNFGSSDRIAAGNVLHVKFQFNDSKVTATVTGNNLSYGIEYTIPNETELPKGYVGLHTAFYDGTADTDTAKSIGSSSVTFDNLVVYDTVNTYIKEIIGDVKVDNIINATDVDAIRNRFLKDSLTADAIDVNKDGAKNIYDYVRLMRILDSMN